MVKIVGNVSNLVDWWRDGCGGGATAGFLRCSWWWLCDGKVEVGEQSFSNHWSSLLLFCEPISVFNKPEPPDSTAPPNSPPLYSEENCTPRNPNFLYITTLSCAEKEGVQGAQGVILHSGLLAPACGGFAVANVGVRRRSLLRFWVVVLA